ncbi:MAG TPA: transglycosylase SLT domain-containing protein, partial [Arthrobacter sp.]|nr:transglycosylase SLT domain-containing protein [Arthrobacter sp.]
MAVPLLPDPKRVTARRLASPLAALAMALAPGAAYADVLEIGESGATWVAGGAGQPLTVAQVSASAAAPATTVTYTAGPDQWRAHMATVAARYDLSPALLEALVWQESRWRANAVSPVGARGLTQLMPGTAREMGVNPDDPFANLEGGAR